jgi:hypothetical protein
VAIDSLCCGLLKVNPMDVLHIKLAQESGLGWIDLSEKNIKNVTLKP